MLNKIIGFSLQNRILVLVASVLLLIGGTDTCLLYTSTQNRKLFLRADVSEKYYPYLNSIGSANFCTPYNNKVYTLTELGGRMLSYGKASGENGYCLLYTSGDVPVTVKQEQTPISSNYVCSHPDALWAVTLLIEPFSKLLILPEFDISRDVYKRQG